VMAASASAPNPAVASTIRQRIVTSPTHCFA
jgi:hypothetical protein